MTASSDRIGPPRRLQATTRGDDGDVTASGRLLPTSGWRQPALLLILAAYLVLAVAYGVATPMLEASDENWHEAAVWQIMAGHGLPILDPAQRGHLLEPVQEAGQPPLYYLLAAAETFWIHPPDPATVLVPSPNADTGQPDRSTWHKSLFVHGPAEAFPWHGLALAVHLQRLLSTACGAVTVAAVYALSRLAAPRRPALAMLAAAFVAFDPMFLFISASVDNDALAIALSTLVLLSLMRALRVGATPRGAVVTGLLLGLAALSKLSAAAIALPTLAVYFHLFRRAHSLKAATQYLLALVIPLFVLTGWWFLRNWYLYSDPLGLAAFVKVAGGRPQALTASGLLSEAPSIFDGFWGVFGIFDILLPAAYYTVARVLLISAGLGLMMVAGRLLRSRRQSVVAANCRTGGSRRTPTPSLPGAPSILQSAHPAGEPGSGPLLLLSGWLALEALLLVYWTSATEASSGRLLFPALGSVAFLMALGLVTLAGRWQTLLSGSLAALLALGAALAIPLAITPAYAAPRFVPAARLHPAVPLAYRYGNLELVGATLPLAPLDPGGVVTVTLDWTAVGPIRQNDVISVQLFGPAGVRVEDQQHRTDAFPGGGTVLTSVWPAGMGLVDRVPIHLRSDVSAPSLVHLEVFVYPDGQSGSAIQARAANGQALDSPEIGRLVYGRTHAIVPGPPPLAVFAQQIALQGAEVPATGRAGSTLRVGLHWRAIATPSAAYTVFVHLGPPDRQPLAQHDQQPLDGKLPTTDWVPGETINDVVHLPLPPNLAPGSYEIYSGLYLPATGARLRLGDGKTQVLIGTVTIG